MTMSQNNTTAAFAIGGDGSHIRAGEQVQCLKYRRMCDTLGEIEVHGEIYLVKALRSNQSGKTELVLDYSLHSVPNHHPQRSVDPTRFKLATDEAPNLGPLQRLLAWVCK